MNRISEPQAKFILRLLVLFDVHVDMAVSQSPVIRVKYHKPCTLCAYGIDAITVTQEPES